MVYYLGLNYLEQAVAAKRNLLGKCLIAVPLHLDHAEEYLHKGNLPDEKYRFPWKRAKTDDQFLIHESTNIFADVQSLTTEDVTKRSSVESFNNQQRTLNTSLTETVNFDLQCDVVPSSNPSTQDPFSPDEFFMEHNLFQETFEKEDLKSFSSTCDPLKIESTENIEEGPVDTLMAVPDVSRLASRLKAVNVKDPLLLGNGLPFSQDCLFRKERKYCNEIEISLQKTFDSTTVKETFPKMTVLAFSKEELKEELEQFETLDPSFLGTDAVNLMKSEMLRSVTVPKTVIVLEYEPAVSTVVCKDVVKQDEIQLQKIEKLDLSPVDTVKSSFLDINAIVVTEQDQFCEKAVLDTPVVDDASSDKHYTQQKLTVPARNLLEFSPSTAQLLDAEQHESLTQRVWQMHKYCDEIQASRLPEPELSKNSRKREPVVRQALKELKVQTDTSTGSADLELDWNIVKYTEEITDPCKLTVPYCTDKSDCEKLINEVDKIEKYGTADLYDWKDEEILFDDHKGNSTENQTQKMGFMQKMKSKFVAVQDDESYENNKKISDPLGDFMTLRSKNTVLQPWNADGVNKVCDSVPKKIELAVEFKKKHAVEEKKELKQNFDSKKKVKHHVVEIKITGKYQHILDILETASEHCMHVLKQKEEIPPCSTFKAITSDNSRFLLKQREKYLLDHKEDGLSDEVYKMIVLLHGLVVASEITENCCLESAIGYLGALQDKYKDVLGGCLDVIRQNLFELNAQLNVQRVQHPKVMTLCKEIETWLKKKRAKTGDSEQKILILVKREMPSLHNCLKDALVLGNLLRPCILFSPEPENIIESLDKHNCMIACTKTISKNFPWAQFSLVVEYENEKSSPWQQLCERQNIRHIGLSMQSEEKIVYTTDTTEWVSKYPQQQICLIGSEKVTKNTELLQLLETRHNILLIERDYSLIENAKHLFFSDVDVDVNTAIVIEDLKSIIDDCVVQNAVTKMVALSLKYTNCWIILLSYKKSGSYHFPRHVISNISRLQAAVSNFVQRSSNFEAKVIFCEGCCELSSLIRNISEQSMTFCKGNTTSSWLDRFWLTNEVSKEEKFLLMLPCLNSMSAQLLLKKVSLRGIFILALEDLSQAVPEISVRILKALKCLICSSTGLHLREASKMNSSLGYDEKIQDCAYQNVDLKENEEINQTKSDVCLLKSPLQRDFKEIAGDIYVPEDFQKCSEDLNTKLDACYDLRDMNMPCRHTPCSKKMNGKSGANASEMKYAAREQYIDEIHACLDAENCDRNKGIYNTTIYNERSEEATESKKKPFEETIIARNEEGGWELLNEFISGNTVSNKSETRLDCVKAKSDDSNVRRLNPVQKLHIMRQRHQLLNTPLRYGSLKCSDAAQYLEEQIGKGINVNSTQKDSSNSVNALQGSAKEHKGSAIERFTEESFAKSGETNVKNKELDSHQDAYPRGNLQTFSPKQSQKTTGLQKTTFEYNHGLPFQTTDAYGQLIHFNSRCSGISLFRNGDDNQFDKTSSKRYLGYATGCTTPNRSIDLEKEFPPAEEIDRSASVECGFENKAKNEFSRKMYIENNKESVRFSKANQNELESIPCNTFDFASTENRELYAKQLGFDRNAVGDICSLAPFEASTKSDESTYFQTSSLFLTNDKPQSEQFNFNPQLFDSRCNDKTQSVQQSQVNRQDLSLNPKLERISHKINSVEESAKSNSAIHIHSLEDDLRETTKKLLANSRQFSRFDTHSKRHPLQKVSIGLAQPRLRKSITESKEELHLSEERRRVMAQSPWATEDSPPMDLEYDNTDFNRILQTEDTSNRVSYTNNTPHKKRKLAYQCVAGKKGQTQLVFK